MEKVRYRQWATCLRTYVLLSGISFAGTLPVSSLSQLNSLISRAVAGETIFKALGHFKIARTRLSALSHAFEHLGDAVRPGAEVTVLCLTAFILCVTAASGGQGAGAPLYTVPNASFIENPTGDPNVISIYDTSGSVVGLQTSINNARNANPGAIIVIHLLSGATYSATNAGLVLGSQECIVGTGAIIKASSPSVTVPLITISSGSTNVSVAGGILDGNGANINGIYAPAAARVNIDALTVKNCGLDGILLRGNGNSTYDNEMAVSRCDASGSPAHAGISIQNATQAVCVDNVCHNSLVGIYLNCAWANVGNNYCYSNTTGIDVAGGNDNVVANNTCTNNVTGIHAGASNNMIVSNVTGSNSSAGINSDGSSSTFIDNLFAAGNANNFNSAGSGNRVIAYKVSLSASGQNYFYPPLIDDQHNNTIVNGMGRTDLTIGSTAIDSVQSQYDAARLANPNNVMVLHLNGTFTVGAVPLQLSSNTCILLNGTIQINGSTTASSAISDSNSPSRVSISGGIIDGGNLTGNNGIQFSSASMLQVDATTLRNFGPDNPRTGGSDVIHFDHGSTPYIVTRCTINGGSARGIWLQLSGVKSLMSDNDVSNVNQDGVDCDSSTSGCVAKYNDCHDLVRYGVFFEQSASHNLALGNICARTGRGINVYNNDTNPRAATQYNTSVCNRCDSNSNGMRNGSTGNTNTLSSHNFAFNNVVINSSSIGIEGDADGVENYYSQNYLSGNGTAITTSGSETFFNPPDVANNLPVGDSLRWNSSSSAVWDTNTLNWFNLGNSLADTFETADNVLFTDTPGVVTSITIPAGFSAMPTTLSVVASTNSFTINGPGKISGSAGIIKDGTSQLTLNSTNDFTGTVSILAGTLKTGNASALGSASGATIIASGATLDVNGFNLGLRPVTVSGVGVGTNGAIVNKGGSIFPALAYVTLAGDTTFGGTGRWDLRSSDTTATNAILSTGGQPFKLTKTGSNQVSLVSVFVDPMLGDIDVQSGLFSAEKMITSLGNSTNTLTVCSNAAFQFFQVSNVLSKVLLLQQAFFTNNSGSNTFGGPIILQGSNTFSVGGNWLNLTNVISGSGSLNKIGSSTLFLSAGNTYTGPTFVTSGMLALVNSGSLAGSSAITINSGAILDVSARSDGQLTLGAGQKLGGTGAIYGSLLAGQGATVLPGASIGALTVTNIVTLLGTTFMELNAATHTNDMLIGAKTIVYGGTLQLTNLSGTFAAGNSFKLFSATNYSGAFTNISPAIPALNLGWNVSTLASDGTLRIVSAPTPQPKITTFTISGGSLLLGGTNGVAGWPYYILASTNVLTPITSWTRIATNQFNAAGGFSYSASVNPASPQQFFMVQLQ
jgi:autotransporter-associated beta strand protein